MIKSVADINFVLGNVVVLILRSNALSSMVGLEKLYNLRRLDLSNNKLSDVNELRELGTLPALQQLWLVRNPLSEHANYRTRVCCAFVQDVVLDGRAPSDAERRARADEQRLRAAASIGSPSSDVTRRKRTVQPRRVRAPRHAPIAGADSRPRSSSDLSSIDTATASPLQIDPLIVNNKSHDINQRRRVSSPIITAKKY